MPAYPWLADTPANKNNDIELRLKALKKLGHPYSEQDIDTSAAALEDKTEMDALIAYMQVLGTAYSRGDTP
jgi:cytochrome c oxidase cbb3-type subunit 2